MSEMWVCASGAQYSFWRINKFLFLVARSMGLRFWRESKINSRCHWRCVMSRWVLPQQREMQIYWWLGSNSEIHLWLWQLWRQVVCSQNSFHVTEARKDDKNRQNTIFLCWKELNLLHNKQFFNKVPFQSTNYRKKELCVDNIKTVGDVYHTTCRCTKCVYNSTNKTTSFYGCKKCKACCHVLKIPFKDQKPTIMLFGGDGTHCFARKTSRDYEKPSPFSKKLLHQWQPGTSEREPKKGKSSPKMEQTYPFPFGRWFEQHSHFSNNFVHFQSTINLHPTYTKSSWSSQSPTTKSSGLSILDPTLLLLQ